MFGKIAGLRARKTERRSTVNALARRFHSTDKPFGSIVWSEQFWGRTVHERLRLNEFGALSFFLSVLNWIER
jgi:hypothetical protein